jgi:hypothetical protein
VPLATLKAHASAHRAHLGAGVTALWPGGTPTQSDLAALTRRIEEPGTNAIAALGALMAIELMLADDTSIGRP